MYKGIFKIYTSLLIIFLLSGAVISFAEENKPTTRSDALSIALDAIKMTTGELSLKRGKDDDPFRLSIVDEAMDRPLEVPDILDSLVKTMEFSSAEEFLKISAPILDIEPANPIFNEQSGKNPWSENTDIPPKLRKSLDILFSAYSDAKADIDEAFSSLDSFQLDTLFSRGPEYLTPGAEKLADEVDESMLEEADMRELEEEKADTRFFTLASRVDREKLFSSAQRIAQAIWTVKNLVDKVEPQQGNGTAPDTIAFGDIIYYTDTEFGPFIIGGEGPTVYLVPCAVIIDLGGDDEYRGGAGGTDTVLKFSVSIDVSGNDVYWSDASFSIGSALGGVGILIDEKGDDHYRGLHHTEATGVFGWGILWDEEGDDVYLGHTAVQGAGFCGGGLLYDKEGYDRYEAHLYSQAFGFVGGLGILYDEEGNDSYICTGASIDKLRYADHNVTLSQGFGYGFRPDYSGGVGIIVEKSGNDAYLSDIFGQAASYWLALGAIYDFSGHDSYTSYQYAQGSGVHLAAAGLVDISGNDAYVAHGVSQGCGHDLAIGFLDDRNGDDNYVTWDLAQGAGNANGIGVLVDEGNGQDSYAAKRNYNVQGYGNWRRDFGSIGLMLDLGGKDAYAGKGSEGKWWSYSNYGIGIDFPDGIPEQTKDEASKGK